MAAPGPTAGSKPLDQNQSPSVSVNETFIEALSTQNLSIQRVIGQGSFSEVYRAIHTETNDVLAIKCFRQEMTSRSLYESAAKEIAIMKVLNHPNIISVKVYGISRTYAYIGTDYGCFGSLQTYAEKRNLNEPEVKKLMLQIVSALDYMHGIGVCHGDLKLQNIICYKIENGVPHLKICDFGLFEIKIGETPFVHRAGSVLYMAPEIVLSKPVDLTCDLWSAGVIMYTLMFKRFMFDIKGTSITDMAVFMRVEAVPEMKGISKFSPTCAHFLIGLLQYDSKKRLQGLLLRSHPFINIQKQEYNEQELIFRAANDINSAIEHFKNNKFGDALVDANKSILELQIKYNFSSDAAHREYLKQKWKSYENFAEQIVILLLTQPDWYPREGPITNEEMRSQLGSTPRLLTGFDIGVHGEMYLQEGNVNKARELFHQALEIILPLMNNEPSSTRKKALGKKVEKWIDCLQKRECPSVESDRSFVPSSSNSMIPAAKTSNQRMRQEIFS